MYEQRTGFGGLTDRAVTGLAGEIFESDRTIEHGFNGTGTVEATCVVPNSAP